MRFRSLLIPMLLCVALAAVSGPAFAQTEGTAATPTETTPTPPAEGAAATPPAEQPAAPPPPPAQPTEQPVTPPTQPADQGWGAPTGGGEADWGTAPATQPADQAWGAPPVLEQPMWGEGSFALPEDQQLRSWPVVFSLGAGIGGTFEGTIRNHLSAVTVEPSVFIGFFKHWGIHHGPFLSLPVGMPGSYDRTFKDSTGADTTITISYGLSFGIVPGYRLFHHFRRDMWWGFGVGYPMLIATWQVPQPQRSNVGRGYTFIPGIIELNAEFAYKFTAGMGVFVKATFQAYDGLYTQLTVGAIAGLVMYYDWFRPWEPPAPSSGEQEDLP